MKNVSSDKSKYSFLDKFLSALLLGAVLGLLIGSFIRMFYTPIRLIPEQMKKEYEKKKQRSLPFEEENLILPPDHPIITYIRAYQNGNYEQIIQQTLWIQDRIQFLREIENKNDDEIQQEIKRIVEQLKEKDINENFLTPNGVDDKYLFSSDSTIKVIDIQKNNTEEEDPRIKEKYYLKIEYHKPSTALRNEKQIPIQSLIAVISITENGKVVKTNIKGNAQIIANSIKVWYTNTDKAMRRN